MAPGYRPPSTEPKGRWARHIHAYRRAQGWNQTRAFEEWHVGLGLAPKSRTAYRAIDLGEREPNAREAEYLAAQIGWPPETQEETGPPSEAGLAQAISALVEELALWRQDREGIEARLRALEAEVQSLRGPRAGGASGALLVPQVGAGSGP